MNALPILYSFRRCPYAIRARMALAVAGIAVELREVLLRDKPLAMLEASAKGTVPVLVLPNGTVIDESEAVMRWALAQADPRGLLNAANSSALIAENDGMFKHHLDRFKYTDRYPGTNNEEQRAAGLAILTSWNQRIAAKGWLLGEHCSLADAALWPFVRQWRIADPEGFFQIMSDKDNGFVQFLLQIQENILHIRPNQRIQGTKRLIHQENICICR